MRHLHIRSAQDSDADGVDALLRAAFPGPEEARLVVNLRAAQADALELVAEEEGEIVGMAMFSPVEALREDGPALNGLGLGPVAVLPARQRCGVGSVLIEEGLEHFEPYPVPFFAVLGDPAYYGRFGFEPASDLGWRWDGDPDGTHANAFRILVRDAKACAIGPAMLSYHPAFDSV